MKKLLAFDLDNTLALHKSDIDSEMSSLLNQLLVNYKIAILSSASFERINRCVVQHLFPENLHNLLVLPVCGAEYYYFENGEFKSEYKYSLSDDEVKTITVKALNIFSNSEFKDEIVTGSQFEHDAIQLSFSMIGHGSPKEIKDFWDPERKKRKAFVRLIQDELSEYDIFIAGQTSIDILKKGYDKSFGMMKLLEINNISKDEAIFFGDAFYPDGNDFPVLKTDVECVSVGNPEDTKNYLKHLL